jgi:hypothetical protein
MGGGMASVAAPANTARGAGRIGRALPLLAAGAIVVCSYAFSPNFRHAAGPNAAPYAGDFLQEWVGGHIVLRGDRERFYDPAYAQALEHDRRVVPLEWDESRYLPIVYPPFYYLLIAPLALLPLRVAAWLWAVLMIAALAATAWLLERAVAGRVGVFSLWTDSAAAQHSRRRTLWQALAPWAIVAAVAFVPVIECFTSSQKGTVCLLILTATFLLQNGKKPLAAGLIFGLLVFKPQLTLAIAAAMLLKGQWRFVVGGTITGVALAGLCLAMGTDVCRQYVEFATGAADYLRSAGYDLHKSHCLYGFFTLLAGGPNEQAKGATLLAIAAVVLLLVQMLRGRLEPGGRRFAVQYSGLVLATLLVSPHVFTYDLAILLLPGFLVVFLLATELERFSSPALIAWLLALLYALAGVSPAVAERCGVQLSVPLLVSLLAALAWQAAKDRRRHRPSAVDRRVAPVAVE